MTTNDSTKSEQCRGESLKIRALLRLYEHAEEIRQHELEEAFTRLQAIDGDDTEIDQDVVETFSQRLVDELLAPPTQALCKAAKRGDRETVQEAMELFQISIHPETVSVESKRERENTRINEQRELSDRSDTHARR